MARTQNNNGRFGKVALMVVVTLATLAGSVGCVPGYGYDPTNIIQSVIGNRLDAMDWSANAWDEYILE